MIRGICIFYEIGSITQMILQGVRDFLQFPDNSKQVFYLDDLDAPIVVKRHPRARRLTLRLRESSREFTLTLPKHCDDEEALRFLKKHTGWLKSQISSLPEFISFADGALIPFRGINHQICFVKRKRGYGVVFVDTQLNSVSCVEAPKLYVSGDTEHAPRRLLDWLKSQARKDIEDRVEYHANFLNLVPKRISVRDPKSRWGSCTSGGNLSFSWRLILAPHYVLDYVAAHEVAHLAEMNHGPEFWKLVRKTLPDMDQAEAWLKHNGAGLHRYGVYEA